MLLKLEQLTIPPGSQLILNNISWKKFEEILDELGEHRSSKLAYQNGILEIMVPLPEHEKAKVFISNFIEILLEELNIEFCPLGSTTFKNPEMTQGIEPDNCFYIQHEAEVRAKERLDLTVDPPPDLALEIEVTSRSHPNIYEQLKVPELWRFEKGKLQINVLRNGKYIEVQSSPIFPNFPLKNTIPEYLKRCKIEGRNTTMRAFRAWVKTQIEYFAP
ncbi:MAG: Uma2 family endonuclease [Cyanobacteriota bacterium]|nr:Uma2 family endonuclease [Cyanobacteriota bacterium]